MFFLWNIFKCEKYDIGSINNFSNENNVKKKITVTILKEKLF